MLEIVYIAGVGRSGSTLLSRLLDAGDDVVGLGEVMRIVPARDLCSCGVPATDCELWGAAFEQSGAELRDLGPLSEEVNRKVLAPWVLTGRPIARRLSTRSDDVALYRQGLATLLGGIRSTIGTRTLLDKSLSPYHLAVLAEVPGVRVRVIHLTRDPRGFAHSVSSEKVEPSTGKLMFQASPQWSSVHYLCRHLLTEAAIRSRRLESVRVAYEDIASDPKSAVTSLRRDLGLSPHLGFDVDDGAVVLPTSHLLSANPMRWEKGQIPIRIDDAWTQRQSARDRRTVSVATAPLLKRYGYR